MLLVVAAVLFALMAVMAKVAAAGLPGTEVAFVRFCIGLFTCSAVATRRRFSTNNRRGLVLRGLYGGGAVLLYFLAIEHLPVGIATLLNYTAPVFTALYAAVFLGERVGPAALGALAVTSAGVGLVITGTAPHGSLGIGLWQLIGIASAMLSGAAVATIREVRKTDGSWEIFAAFCFAGAVITLPPALVSWVAPAPAQWAELAAVGSLSVAAQLLMTHSLRFVRAAVAGIIAQLTPVASLAMGRVLFHDAVSGLALAGASVTLLGVSWGAVLASNDAAALQRRAKGDLPA